MDNKDLKGKKGIPLPVSENSEDRVSGGEKCLLSVLT